MMSVKKLSSYSLLLCEGLLIYFVLVPLYKLSGQTVPLWSYVLAVIIAVFLGFISVTYIKNYVVLILNLFINFLIVTYLFDFSLLVGTVYTLLFIWRLYIHITYTNIENHKTIILLLFFLLIINSIFFYHHHLMIMAAFLLILVMVHYLLGHILSHHHSKKSLNYVIGLILACLFGSVILILVFPVLRFIVSVVLLIVRKVILLFATLLSNVIGDTIDFTRLQKWAQNIDGSSLILDFSGFEDIRPEDFSENTTVVENHFNWWLIVIGVVALIAISFLLMRKRFILNDEPEIASDAVISVTLDHDLDHKFRNSKTFSHLKKPNHPIRKQVLKLEQLATKMGVGRKQSETIEEWFTRLEVNPAYLDLYQKVRYGNFDLSEKEEQVIQKYLIEIKGILESYKKTTD